MNTGNNSDDGVVDMEVDLGQEEEPLVAFSAHNNSHHHDDVADMEKEEEPVIIANKNNKDDDDDNNPYECSICLDMAIDPIVTCCGHLFCCPCFSRVKKKKNGLFQQHTSRECPVCKGEVKDSAVNPIFNVNNMKSPFKCSICLLDMAIDPIVTCCAHLFCWPCFFRVKPVLKNGQLLRECPVCKGEVEHSAITPIYANAKEEENKSSWWVPPRPKAQRVEMIKVVPSSSNRSPIIIISVADLPIAQRLYVEELFAQFDTPPWLLSP